MNVTNLILHLKAMITDNTLDQAMVSKAIKLLELGAVYQADTFASLPTPSAANAGQLYYVLYDGLYWSTGEYWLPIVRTDLGFAWSWGQNTAGRLGNNAAINRSSPVSVVGGFNDWSQISVGNYHMVGVRSAGTVWAWGCNNVGMLGDDSSITRSSPVLVAGGFTDWCRISAGRRQTLALRKNGTAWAWGCNNFGQLGDNTSISRSSPVSVVGGFTDWCQVAAGEAHSLALRSNGTAWGWGINSSGELGDNCTISRSSPVSVVGGFTDWCQLSAGRSSSSGITNTGILWTWGSNGQGRLGDNSVINRSSPVSVVGGFTDWCQSSIGLDHMLAVRNGGTAWAWGCGRCGQLGNNCLTDRSSPVSVVGGFTDWCQVAASNGSSLAVRTNGTAWGWGFDQCGRLGDNSTINRSSPVSVVGGFTDWCQVSQWDTTSAGLRGGSL